MPRSKYEVTVKKREACSYDKGLEGCHKCCQNIWGDHPCDLSYELAAYDVENVECRIAEIHEHYDAVQYLEDAIGQESQKDFEADLKKHYGDDITLAEFVEQAELFVRKLKERVSVRDNKTRLH